MRRKPSSLVLVIRLSLRIGAGPAPLASGPSSSSPPAGPQGDLQATLTQKSPTRLLIESQLRAWVLRRCGRCLPTLAFAELVRLTEGRPVPAAPRVYHGRDESRARWTEKLDRHRAALKSH